MANSKRMKAVILLVIFFVYGFGVIAASEEPVEIKGRTFAVLRRGYKAPSNIWETTDTSQPRPLLTDGEAEELVGSRHLTSDPINNRLAFTSCARPVRSNGGQSNRIILIDVDTGSTEVLVDNECYNEVPEFSPDGKKLAFFSARADLERRKWELHEGYALNVLDFTTNKVKRLAPPDRTPLMEGRPAWSPDGSQIAFVARYNEREGAKVHVVNANGDQLHVEVGKGQRYDAKSVVWPESGRLLANEMGVGIYELKPGSDEVKLVQKGYFMGELRLSPDRKYLKGPFLDVVGGPTGEKYLDAKTLNIADPAIARRSWHEKQ